MSIPPVILYRYDASPFSHKIDNALTVKGVPHEKVNVVPMLPRPEITDALGITYRRIPILAIGNDVYCDTSLITSVLERRFPTSKGYRSLFPARKNGGSADTGLVKAISNFYADRVLFAPASSLLPWDKIPESFLKDRSALRGSPLDRKAIAAARPLSETFLSSNILLIEEQLSDSRDWLFDTESPSLADISIHFVFAWARSFKGTESLFDSSKNPHTVKWLDRMNDFLKKQRASQKVPTKLHGADAASRIVSGSHESYDIVGFEALEASRLGVKLGDIVQIAPEDTGKLILIQYYASRLK
ncbi:hypothetical protein NLJ89_g4566 [Agrocybe chaxingu]|uniref:GST N-terminal domain-containing protein n=1 Tax=Agrocybe chaxingu TaxID=84603 RepID=A0A9W8MXX2_9AGAR|nr:hypothetical protein NLJ89_g4566 [Agrocybe chaxingu]